MSTKIMTVCGPIDPQELGFTSMHEHIVVDCSMFRNRIRKSYIIPPSSINPEGELTLINRSKIRHSITLSLDNLRLDNEAVMAEEVAEFKAGGGHSIVEVSAPGIRSSPNDLLKLRRISEQTGVHIIASTGLYAEYTWPAKYRDMVFTDFTVFLHREIRQGIGKTGILPGHIKAAYEAPSQVLDDYLRAAALVSGETGLSLQVHLGPYLTIDEVRRNVLQPLLEGGCNPRKTILCHVQLLMGILSIDELINNPGRLPFDISLHKELLDQGFILSFTPFGFEADDEPLGIAHYPDWYILSGLVQLIREGYAEQLVIGNDVFTKLATCHGGGEGYRRLTDFVVPSLQQCGIATQEINKIVVGNPARILAF
ncbi:phosphotriesterase [bacterium BFN5]|nr:phosphotriesterase [bacterium BFN5]QJW44681.1 phosphotriesterase [bacterium BFN5]